MPADNRTVLNELEDQNRENVILGLECCAKGSDCRKCPYYNRYRYGNINECTARLADDALAILNEQERRIVDLEQLIAYERNVKARGSKQKA